MRLPEVGTVDGSLGRLAGLVALVPRNGALSWGILREDGFSKSAYIRVCCSRGVMYWATYSMSGIRGHRPEGLYGPGRPVSSSVAMLWKRIGENGPTSVSTSTTTS